jgi:DNA-binding CsgD family transcriptional regulator
MMDAPVSLSRAQRAQKTIATRQWRERRDAQILGMVRAGATYQEIADDVICAVTTVGKVIRAHREVAPRAKTRKPAVKRQSFWTQSRCTQLTQLWEGGQTGSEIGATMGCSRNAVIGKAHRLGLPPRPSPIRRIA